MAVLPNAKHERFAQELAKGASQREAYVTAGYKPDDGAASRLSSNVKVQGRVTDLLQRAATRAETTAADIARQLDEDRIFARENGAASAAVAATMGKAKVLGLIIDKSDVKADVNATVTAIERLIVRPSDPNG
jgi:hypothetical protein